jgi:DNA-binding response OmpR family regulator
MITFDILRDLRILIVEDEYLLANDMMNYLQDIGVDVVGPVATVAAAVELLRTTDVQAAVLDVNLRGDRVYPVADLLRERHVPFVFASGYGSELEAADYADVPRCIKPVDFPLLAKSLAAHIQQQVCAH